jgi:hypothetical protein
MLGKIALVLFSVWLIGRPTGFEGTYGETSHSG